MVYGEATSGGELCMCDVWYLVTIAHSAVADL